MTDIHTDTETVFGGNGVGETEGDVEGTCVS